MAGPIQNYGYPYFSPPPPHNFPSPPKVAPPHKPFAPPPPPAAKPPPPPHVIPPPSPPSGNNTVIIIVFVSLGCLFFLAFLAVALFCFVKKKKKQVQETKLINFDEHLKVQEAIIPGPHGTQAVILSLEEDVHIQEAIKKNETVGEGLHAKSADGREGLHAKSVDDLEAGASSSGSSLHLIEPKP